jgi:hypothetical protein
MIDNIRWWTGRVILAPFLVVLSVLVVVLSMLVFFFVRDTKELCDEVAGVLKCFWGFWLER